MNDTTTDELLKIADDYYKLRQKYRHLVLSYIDIQDKYLKVSEKLQYYYNLEDEIYLTQKTDGLPKN